MTTEALPDTLFVCAALPDGVKDESDLSEVDGLTLVSLTDAEETGFMPVFSEEKVLLSWIKDFQVEVMSVSIPKEMLMNLAREGNCEYLVLDLAPGQDQFPLDQVFNL